MLRTKNLIRRLKPEKLVSMTDGIILIFFFGITLSYKLYSVTDNLSKLLQSTKMLTIKGKNFTDLIIETIQKMRNNSGFKMFCQVVKKASESVKTTDGATCSGNK